MHPRWTGGLTSKRNSVIKYIVISFDTAMYSRDFEVVNHPARMRIFQVLLAEQLSIHQIAERLPDVPLPSLYRHVKKLHDAGLVVVAATRSINGIEERFYTAVQGLIDPDALDKPESMDAFAEHVSVYGMVVAQAAAQHIAQRGAPDLNNLAVRDHFFYATEEEFLRLREAIYALLEAAAEQPPAPGRVKRRWFVVAHPLTGNLEEGEA
jgi:DNA-binding transcriptional ArsR family regulator